MASGRCSGWFYLWIIILSTDLAADSTSPPRYTIHHPPVTFEQAVKDCSSGVLTPLVTDQDVVEVLKLVSYSVKTQSDFTFWVGLKKDKKDCVISTEPLRGFKWIEGGSKIPQVIDWAKEPQFTCVSAYCAALTGNFNGSTVTRWGLTPVSCRKTYGFICKLTGQTPENKGTNITSATTKPEPPAPELKPATPEPTKPETPKPEPVTPEPKLPTQPEPDTDPKSTTGPGVVRPQPSPGSELMLGSDSCQHPVIPGSRFLRLDPNNSSRIQVECWSSYQLELHCQGHPALWHLPDDSPANFTTICQPCEAGSQKDASGNCVDISKCRDRGNASCRHSCLDAEGSEACTNSVTTEDGSLLSRILIPVLVAVAALVVLVVVVALVVKCCLMKRSKK